MHPYQEALRTQISLGTPQEEIRPGRGAFALLGAVSGWLEIPPCVYGSREGKAVYILYRDTALVIADFWDNFGRIMSQINKTWPLCAYGTAENQETIRLLALANEDCIELVQQTISGEDKERIHTLCFQIDCTASATADRLISLLRSTDWRTGIAAMSWREADFLQEQKLALELKNKSLFCYVSLHSHTAERSLLDALNFEQKITLWTSFLKEGFEPVEFEWLMEEISADSLDNRMEWELALREAMVKLHFRMINRCRDFEIYDGAGQRRYFGADCRQPAQRALVKILFPLNS